MNDQVLVVTTNDVPGYDVVEVYGEIFANQVRARNVVSSVFSVGFRQLVGGRVGALTKVLVKSRQQVIDELKQEAANLGANAVLAMRFDASSMDGGMTELVAYGTAVGLAKK